MNTENGASMEASMSESEDGCAEGPGRNRSNELRRAVRFHLRLLWCRTGYRSWARLLHRFDLHHTRSHMIDDTVLTKCDWCGLAQSRRTTASLTAEKHALSRGPSVSAPVSVGGPGK